jgi:hypothetical protein
METNWFLTRLDPTFMYATQRVVAAGCRGDTCGDAVPVDGTDREVWTGAPTQAMGLRNFPRRSLIAVVLLCVTCAAYVQPRAVAELVSAVSVEALLDAPARDALPPVAAVVPALISAGHTLRKGTAVDGPTTRRARPGLVLRV